MCPFKLNEEVIYIGETFGYAGITNGNKYRVTECRGRLYDNLGITNDVGVQFIPIWSNYISLKDFRKRKLDKISRL